MKVRRLKGRKTRMAMLSKQDREWLREALSIALLKTPEALPRSEWTEPEDCTLAAQRRAWARLWKALN